MLEKMFDLINKLLPKGLYIDKVNYKYLCQYYWETITTLFITTLALSIIGGVLYFAVDGAILFLGGYPIESGHEVFSVLMFVLSIFSTGILIMDSSKEYWKENKLKIYNKYCRANKEYKGE